MKYCCHSNIVSYPTSRIWHTTVFVPLYLLLLTTIFATIRTFRDSLFATIRHYSPLFATIRHHSYHLHYSRLFSTIRTIRDYSHYSYYSVFAILDYSLLEAFRGFQTPESLECIHRRERLGDQSILSKNRTQRPQCAPKLWPLDPGGFKR